MKSVIWLGLSVFFLIAGILAHKWYIWIPAALSLLFAGIIILVQSIVKDIEKIENEML